VWNGASTPLKKIEAEKQRQKTKGFRRGLAAS
jgi:hypothetical protein